MYYIDLTVYYSIDSCTQRSRAVRSFQVLQFMYGPEKKSIQDASYFQGTENLSKSMVISSEQSNRDSTRRPTNPRVTSRSTSIASP